MISLSTEPVKRGRVQVCSVRDTRIFVNVSGLRSLDTSSVLAKGLQRHVQGLRVGLCQEATTGGATMTLVAEALTRKG
jgi:hypothetical protein